MYIFEAETSNFYYFSSFIKALNKLKYHRYIFMKFDENGIRVLNCQSVHKNIEPVYLLFESQKFDKYHCQENKEYCINLVDLHDSLVNTIFDSKLTLYIDDDDLDHLGIKIVNNIDINTVVKLKFLDYENTNKYVDSMVMDTRLFIPDTFYFQKIIDCMANMYEHVCFELSPEKLTLTCEKDTVSIKTSFYATHTTDENYNNNTIMNLLYKYDLKSLSLALSSLNYFIDDVTKVYLYFKDDLLLIRIANESLGYIQIGVKEILSN